MVIQRIRIAPMRSERKARMTKLGLAAAAFGALRSHTPSSGANRTATNHETMSAIVTTAKMENVYSPAALRAKPIGTKPAMVTKVPVSIGIASVLYAKDAASSLLSPCANRVVITSMVVIALSTSRLSEMMSAPSEMRWRSICIACMIGKTIAMVSGMVSATTEPGLNPRLMMLTAMMMAIACQSDSMNSPIAVWTTTGWSLTSDASMPSGRLAMLSLTAFFTLRPSARMSPPSRIAMARPMAGLPLTRNIGWGGSA